MEKIFSVILFVFLNLTVSSQALDSAVLREIIQKSESAHSDGLIIFHDGKLIVEEYFGKKPKLEYLASAGKSLVAIAVCRLVDEGKIRSLDQPVYEFFPEWKQGQKKLVTIRMLLNHTSGIQNIANASVELEPPPTWKVNNVIQLALSAELSDPPGTVFSYNNKAVALLGGIIEKASGLRMDAYFQKTFFKVMEIKEADWIRDESGNPTAHGAFILSPMDFAKFGLLLLQKGVYRNIKLLASQWTDTLLAPGQPFDSRFGLLWWRMPRVNKRVITEKKFQLLQEKKVAIETLNKLQPLVNDTLTEKEYSAALTTQFGLHWYHEINQALTPSGLNASSIRELISSREADIFYAHGNRGNYMVLIPAFNLVAVRVKGNKETFNMATDEFSEFPDLVGNLVK